ncbi:MAG TPA: single-stranded DNA-binding protein [Ignavibacteriaceae bacterium]|jgi:single-strand DNA-binding protein|nr:MAG: Single-stranded DNA-binding protein ssb [Ignavibacteria bacterium ADurb.Bin266]OQY71598.1 MAG: single-stranded DNA-binding protein [Ignavibacteriales bacterium UTCHB2]HQF43141.1 single-stranded DNA-binding protein [Ignavibacteriaceae bacterium]HQI41448.1 single-stranded DNA-binding protein [Ignavibacteriaceae bacterium]
MADLKMPEINYVIVAGNLTKDPVFRETTNRTPVVNFSIASNRKFKDSSNQWQEDVCYIGVVAWNKLAESCRDRLRKGSAVLVDGELQSRSWKSDDGHNRSIVEIKARRIQFLNKRLIGSEENDIIEDDEPSIAVDDTIDYTEDSFDKFLSEEESSLIKQTGSENEERN